MCASPSQPERIRVSNFQVLSRVGASTALIATALFASSAAYAADPVDPVPGGGGAAPPAQPASSLTWTAQSLCPDETATLNINGVSSQSTSNLTAPEVFQFKVNGTQVGINVTTLSTGPSYPYEYFTGLTASYGDQVTVSIVNSSTSAVVSTSTITLGNDTCPDPAASGSPEATPTASALPDTGVDANSLVATGAAAALVAAAGASLVVARRRKARA